jgi:hypothetical protein
MRLNGMREKGDKSKWRWKATFFPPPLRFSPPPVAARGEKKTQSNRSSIKTSFFARFFFSLSPHSPPPIHDGGRRSHGAPPCGQGDGRRLRRRRRRRGSGGLALRTRSVDAGDLGEPEPELVGAALRGLDAAVPQFWFELAQSIGALEAAAEDEASPHRELASLVASKVIECLIDGGETEEAMAEKKNEAWRRCRGVGSLSLRFS